MNKIIISLCVTVFVPLTVKLGDSSRVVCSSAQSLFQIIMSHCVTNPQAVMDHVVETCLAHKSFRVKRGGIICLLRTIRK